MRLIWIILRGSTLIEAIITGEAFKGPFSNWLLTSLFELVSLVSQTGYESMATGAFPRGAGDQFLLLMIEGGCAGSNAGGKSLIRVGLLGKLLTRDIHRLRLPPHALKVPAIDGRVKTDDAFRQAMLVPLLRLA